MDINGYSSSASKFVSDVLTINMIRTRVYSVHKSVLYNVKMRVTSVKQTDPSIPMESILSKVRNLIFTNTDTIY